MPFISILSVVALLAVAISLPTFAASAQPSLTIDVAHPAGPVSPRLYGLMTEEINHSYEGGLYAELVQNRDFLSDDQSPVHWSPVVSFGSSATIAIDRTQPLSDSLPASLRVEVTQATETAMAGIANEGFWGMGVRPATPYRASFYARATAVYDGPVTLVLQSNDGLTTFASAKVKGLTDHWQRFETVLRTGTGVTPTAHARFALLLDRPGKVWFTLVSLFPPTWKNRPNGLRPDIMQLLVNVEPKFLRFPGGSYVQGSVLAERYDWKRTIGPLTERPGHRSMWGYRSTDGLGLLEFCQWAEDLGAEPVLAVFAGYTLNQKDPGTGDALKPYVQDALDEIEYITGDVSTKWGKRRAADGHPEPFVLNFIEIGNEDFFDKSGSYDARFKQFYDAIKAKHPRLNIVSTIGTEQKASGLMVKSRMPDVLDEHYYRAAEDFIKMSPTFYEQYLREKGPDIFVGEWASFEDPKAAPWDKVSRTMPPTPSIFAAIGDAAFMVSAERNCDVVKMHCYAPLLANVNPGAYQWRPDLIGYDALTAFGSPSYHAFKMFSTHLGDLRLQVKTADTRAQASATQDSASGAIFIKLVNPAEHSENLLVRLTGAESVDPTAEMITLAARPDGTNSILHPETVTPKETSLNDIGPSFNLTVPPCGIAVLKLDRVVSAQANIGR